MAILDSFAKITDGDQLDNGYFNEQASEPWYKLKYDGDIGAGLIKFSSTIWQTSTGRTTDGGSNWSAGGYNTISAEDIATSSGATGIAFDNSDASSSYVTDSGATWQASSVSPANATNINACDLASTTVGVCCGLPSSLRGIWCTSDSGDNWTQATTGPTVEVVAIAMASTTIGYAVDVNENIWKTTDAGVNWTDTTDNMDAQNIICESTDIVYGVQIDEPNFFKYVNSTNTITQYSNFDIGNSLSYSSASNIVKATNGNYYFAYFSGLDDAATSGRITNLSLFKFDGTNFYMKPMGFNSSQLSDGSWLASSTAMYNILIEVSNVLHLAIGNSNILSLNEWSG